MDDFSVLRNRFIIIHHEGEKVMQYFKSQRGYSLLLVITIVVLFGVLATSMLTFTATGVKRNEIREDITKATEMSKRV